MQWENCFHKALALIFDSLLSQILCSQMKGFLSFLQLVPAQQMVCDSGKIQRVSLEQRRKFNHMNDDLIAHLHQFHLPASGPYPKYIGSFQTNRLSLPYIKLYWPDFCLITQSQYLHHNIPYYYFRLIYKLWNLTFYSAHQSLMYIVNNWGPRIDLWCTPPVTPLHPEMVFQLGSNLFFSNVTLIFVYKFLTA